MSSTEGPPSKMNWRGSACKNLQETVVQLLEKTAQGRGIQGVVGAGAPLGGGDEALVGQEIHVVGNGGRARPSFSEMSWPLHSPAFRDRRISNRLLSPMDFSLLTRLADWSEYF